MAGPGLSGYDIVLEQSLLINKDAGATDEELERIRIQQTQVLDTVISNEGWDELQAMLIEATIERLSELPDDQKAQFGDLETYAAQVIGSQMAALQSPWYRFFIAYDPAKDLVKINVPILAIFGGLDLQVPAKANAAAVRAATEAAGNGDVTVEIIPNANHLFQAAESGGVDEYSTLAPEFVPGFLETISEWLLKRVELVQ
jgi:pimeloyl-ACP methyl ester carboxylesterase